MGNLAKFFILACGIIFVGIIINLLIKRKISEKNSMVWLIGTILILILSAIPRILDTVAGYIGIEYPPSLLFLLSTLVMLYLLLVQSIQISVLTERLKELTQNVALGQSMEKNEAFHDKESLNSISKDA